MLVCTPMFDWGDWDWATGTTRTTWAARVTSYRFWTQKLTLTSVKQALDPGR